MTSLLFASRDIIYLYSFLRKNAVLITRSHIQQQQKWKKKQHFSTTWLQIRILHTKTQLLFFKTWYICSNYFLTEHSFLISREVNFNTKLSFTLCTRWNATWINMHIYQGNCLKYKLMVNWHSNLQKIFENSSIILSIFQT